MTVLVIDTAVRFCQAGLYEAADDRMIAARSEDIGRGHAERLMGLIADIMADGGLPFEALTGITVTVGPGSFTGIRVGVAAARGIALTRGFEATGVTALQSLATQAVIERFVETPFAVAVEGGRGQIFLQQFDQKACPVTQPQAVDKDNAASAVSAGVIAIVGSAAPSLAVQMSRPMHVYLDRPVGTLEAVARAGRDHPVPARPLYLRGADAKPQTGFALPRAASPEAAR